MLTTQMLKQLDDEGIERMKLDKAIEIQVIHNDHNPNFADKLSRKSKKLKNN